MRGYTITMTRFTGDYAETQSGQVRFPSRHWALLGLVFWLSWRKRHEFPRTSRGGTVARLIPDASHRRVHSIVYESMSGQRRQVTRD